MGFDFKDLLQRINNYLNNLPTIIKNSPKDEKIAYGVILGGIMLLIIGMFSALLF